MINLKVFNNDGLEIVIDLNTGEAYATQAGYCRMSGKSQSTISSRMNGQRGIDIKMAEILTAGGLQGVRLIPSVTVFEWLIDDNPELAKAMGKAGATVYMHQLAGYKTESKEKPKRRSQMILEMAQELAEHDFRIGDLEEENERLKQDLNGVLNVVRTQTTRIQELEEVTTEHTSEIEHNAAEVGRYVDGHSQWHTIVGYANLKNMNNLDTRDASILGKKASSLCKKKNIKPRPTNDPRFGRVNTYPDFVLKEVM